MDTVGPSPVCGEPLIGAAAAETIPPTMPGGPGSAPQLQLLDYFFPGFSVLSAAVNKYLHIDLNLYIPLVLLCGGLTFVWRYFTEYLWGLISDHLMSVVDVRPDDECYNFLMSWVANQRFAKTARRFVVNTNLNSRVWYLWRYWDEDEDESENEELNADGSRKKKALAYTPTFGSHWFIYKGRILIFRRSQPREQSPWLMASEREEISISCFGRDPTILKELLHEARDEFMKRDEAKTLIYRGTTKSGSSEPQWQRCMARTSRPFSTVILNEKVKKELIDDVSDYLNPATRRWYANRGIPYRRGYLLYGPPGTGKSSLSLALAGFFKMRIYIVSLSSVTANEENLATLFAELPRRCVVLLEDIDTAGLTHTREDDSAAAAEGTTATDADSDSSTTKTPPGAPRPPMPTQQQQQQQTGRLSLSGLLNILDGVASQEGRVLIMTTNHLEKLDKALIRPGRVDMIVKFGLADRDMTAQIFKSLYAPIEGDEEEPVTKKSGPSPNSRALWELESRLKPVVLRLTPEEERKKAEAEAEAARKREETMARVEKLAEEFAAKIPEHEFSPAEIQGFLLKNKRAPEKAVDGAEKWVVERRKEKKEKEIKEAEERRKKAEQEAKEKEEQEKKEKEEKEKEEKEKEKKKKGKQKSKSPKKDVERSEDEKFDSSSSSSSSGPATDADSESSESEAEEKKRRRKKASSKKSKSKPSEPEAKTAPVEVDTDKAKEAKVDKPQQTPSADSGSGTPS